MAHPMLWKRVDGKAVPYRFPWHCNPNYHAEMKARGKGPSRWYHESRWVIDLQVVGNLTFIVGRGTNAFEIPSYAATDERKRVASLDNVMKVSRRLNKSFRAGEGLLADPLKLSKHAMRTFKGNWVTEADVRLMARLVEFLGIAAANPGIRKRQVAAIYNTTQLNIDRLIQLARAAGVCFAGLGAGKLRIESFGAFSKENILLLYKHSNGLAEIVEQASVVVGEPSDERTGKLDMKQAKLNLAALWDKKTALDQQQKQGD